MHKEAIVKPIFALMLLLGVHLGAAEHADRHFNAWSVPQQQSAATMFTKGYFSKTRLLALLPDSDCVRNSLQLQWDTYDPNVMQYLHSGDRVKFIVGIDSGREMTMPFRVLSIEDTPNGIVLSFGYDSISDDLLQLLKRGNEVRFEITGTQGLVKRFDLKKEYFELGGFTAAYKAMCKKGK